MTSWNTSIREKHSHSLWLACKSYWATAPQSCVLAKNFFFYRLGVQLHFSLSQMQQVLIWKLFDYSLSRLHSLQISFDHLITAGLYLWLSLFCHCFILTDKSVVLVCLGVFGRKQRCHNQYNQLSSQIYICEYKINIIQTLSHESHVNFVIRVVGVFSSQTLLWDDRKHFT